MLWNAVAWACQAIWPSRRPKFKDMKSIAPDLWAQIYSPKSLRPQISAGYDLPAQISRSGHAWPLIRTAGEQHGRYGGQQNADVAQK